MAERKPLTHARQAETAKPEAKPYTLNAGDGLFLKVMPNGTKKWMWRYFFLKKAKSLSMGLFPAVGLAEAKEARDAARKILARGDDPSQRRKEEKAAVLTAHENSFKAVAEMWRVLGRDGILFVRLASSIGIESRVRRLDGERFLLPDGSERLLVDEPFLLGLGARLGGVLVDPLKTTNVQNLRAMTTWVLRKT